MPISEVAIGGIAGGLITIMVAFAGFIRRLSRDKTELVKDRAETDVIELLTQQRREALDEVQQMKIDLEMIAEENEIAIEKIRDLSAKNAQLKSQVALLDILVTRLAGTRVNMAEATEAAHTLEPTPATESAA